MFYNIFAVLQVLATIPISSLSCDCERSISLMDTHAEIELELNELIDLFQPILQKNEDNKYLRRLDTLLW